MILVTEELLEIEIEFIEFWVFLKEGVDILFPKGEDFRVGIADLGSEVIEKELDLSKGAGIGDVLLIEVAPHRGEFRQAG